MKDIDGYEISDNVLKAINQYIESNGVLVTIKSIKKDTEIYHVEFIGQVFKSISIPTYEIERIIRNNKINEILN